MAPRLCVSNQGGASVKKSSLRTPKKNRSLRSHSRATSKCPSPSSPFKKVALAFHAVEQGNLQRAKDLIQHVGPAVRQLLSQSTLLHTAASHGKKDSVSFLLELISPNVVDSENQTPAHMAAKEGHIDVLKILVADAEMNPDIRDIHQRTYRDWLADHLFEAILSGDEKKTKELLSLGASPDAQLTANKEGVLRRELSINTPRQLALKLNKRAIVDLLQKEKITTTCITKKLISVEPSANGFKIEETRNVGPLRVNVKMPRSNVTGDIYKSVDGTRGFVIILSFGSFQGRPDLEMEASTDDACNLANVFRQMGYTGEVHCSLSSKETKDTLTRIRDMKELNRARSVTFIISSHSTTNNDAFLTSDMGRISTEWLLNFFSDSECPQLKDKPKLFIFDFCRGYYRDTIAMTQRPFKVPRVQQPLKDMMCLYSSDSGFTSYSFSKDGSVFSTALCRTLARHAHDMEVNDLYRELVRECGRADPSPLPHLRNIGFIKQFYFNTKFSS